MSASVVSLLTSPLRGVEYFNGVMETAVSGHKRPSSVPSFTETTNVIRDEVGKNIAEKHGEGARFVYNTVMSGADTVIAGLTGNVSGSIILGTGTASDTANDIMERGGSEEEALIGGAVSGIMEGIFERFSLSELEAMKLLPVNTVKDVVGNITKSVVTNAGEEFSTELANTVFDTIFMGELSTYALTVQGYMSQGRTEADAKKLANGDLFARLCESAASDALMGVLFGGGASASSYYCSQLAAQGESKLRAKEMPTPRELDALNASEAEARGAMVMLNLDQVDGGTNSTEVNEFDYNDAAAEAISGARITEPESSAAEAHANRYYGLVRSMTTDVTRISQNTGYSEDVIRRIKNFIFMDKHDLGGTEPCRFDPSFAMAQSWQRLIAGTPEPHDLTMLKHEIFESELMDAGVSQYDAHIEASKKYNYTKESDDYYGSFGQR